MISWCLYLLLSKIDYGQTWDRNEKTRVIYLHIYIYTGQQRLKAFEIQSFIYKGNINGGQIIAINFFWLLSNSTNKPHRLRCAVKNAWAIIKPSDGSPCKTLTITSRKHGQNKNKQSPTKQDNGNYKRASQDEKHNIMLLSNFRIDINNIGPTNMIICYGNLVHRTEKHWLISIGRW